MNAYSLQKGLVANGRRGEASMLIKLHRANNIEKFIFINTKSVYYIKSLHITHLQENMWYKLKCMLIDTIKKFTIFGTSTNMVNFIKLNLIILKLSWIRAY